MSVKRWLGNAPATKDLFTVSLSGTVISQTYTMTINGKTVSYTASGIDTVATILAQLVSLWNLSTITEFAELTAAGLPGGGPFTSMTLTGDQAGRPSLIAVATGGAATFSIANTTPATGPNDFSNGVNWTGGVAPVNSDTLVFDSGTIGCLYNITTTLTGITVIVQPGYSGAIGLPAINKTSSNSYTEFRPLYLTLAGGTATINGPSLPRCNIDFGAHTAVVRVLDKATRSQGDSSTPSVLINGGDVSSSLNITKGDVGVAFYANTAATFPTIDTGFSSNAASDVVLYCGTGATLTNLVQNGGNVTVQSALTLATLGISGGILTIQDGSAVTITALNGTVNLNTTGTIGTVNLYNTATLNCDSDPRPKSITNPINCFNSTVRPIDNQRSINGGTLSLAPQNLTSVAYQHGGDTSIVCS